MRNSNLKKLLSVFFTLMLFFLVNSNIVFATDNNNDIQEGKWISGNGTTIYRFIPSKSEAYTLYFKSSIYIDIFNSDGERIYKNYIGETIQESHLISKKLEGELNAGQSYQIKITPKQDRPYRFIIKGVTTQEPELEGSVSGYIKDAITNQPIENVFIKIYKEAQLIKQVNSNDNGMYLSNVEVGSDYKIVVEKEGYIPVEYNGVEIIVNQTTHIETILLIPSEYDDQIGTIKGTIIDSVIGRGVDELEVKMRMFMNNTSGSVLEVDTTENAGQYQFDFESGQYTLEVSGDGYITTYFNVICIGGTVVVKNAEITPIIPDDQIRIVLTWDEVPRDLDSHLTGPTPEGDEFHVYYSDDSYYYEDSPYVELDLDDTSSYGPETITIYNQLDGKYRYYVHDFTNGDSSEPSSELSNSAATVKVYKGNALLRIFNVPQNQEGTIWSVFEIDGDVITPINMINIEGTSNDSDDSDTTDDSDANINNIRSINDDDTYLDFELFKNLPAKN